MRNDYQGISGWWRGRKRHSWVFQSPSKVRSYAGSLNLTSLGEVKQCSNLEQIKALEPALSFGLQEHLRLNDQLLRDVLPVMCADGRVVLLVTYDAIHSDAVRGLVQKLLDYGYEFGQYAYVVVDAAVLLAVRRTLPTDDKAVVSNSISIEDRKSTRL